MRQTVSALFVLLVLFLAGCSTSAVQTEGSRKAQSAPVTTAVVVEKPMPVDIRVVGGVETMTAVRVKSMVTGQLVQRQSQRRLPANPARAASP